MGDLQAEVEEARFRLAMATPSERQELEEELVVICVTEALCGLRQHVKLDLANAAIALKIVAMGIEGVLEGRGKRQTEEGGRG